jgi:hypothetical protein
MERLNGTSYYKQTRKCGKDGCHCEFGKEHGPYWYARGATGRIRYIGVELPADIQNALAIRSETREAMRSRFDNNERMIVALREANRAMWSFWMGDHLDDHQVRLIEETMGISLRLV